jgi:hypothetical protein
MVEDVFGSLDVVDRCERSVVLTEIHRVLRPAGQFYFSCHLLNDMADAIQMLSDDVTLTRRSRRGDISAGRAPGWVILRGPGDFRTFYACAHRFYSLTRRLPMMGSVHGRSSVYSDSSGCWARLPLPPP